MPSKRSAGLGVRSSATRWDWPGTGKAAELADRVEQDRREHPSEPVWLIGVSAGTGLVVWGIEELPPDHRVSGAVLIASSLSHRYDLGPVLRKTDRSVYSFYSPVDPVLSLGVTWAGTVDRSRQGTSGGLLTFKPPKDAPQATVELYKAKLTQVGWKPGDVVLGHMGGHLGATQSAYVRRRVAPLLLGQEPAAASRRSRKALKTAGSRTHGGTATRTSSYPLRRRSITAAARVSSHAGTLPSSTRQSSKPLP